MAVRAPDGANYSWCFGSKSCLILLEAHDYATDVLENDFINNSWCFGSKSCLILLEAHDYATDVTSRLRFPTTAEQPQLLLTHNHFFSLSFSDDQTIRQIQKHRKGNK